MLFRSAANISLGNNRVQIRFSDKVRLHPYVFVMAKSEYGDRLLISDGRVTMMQLYMGRTLDISVLLGFMRYLRAAKEEALAMEAASE